MFPKLRSIILMSLFTLMMGLAAILPAKADCTGGDDGTTGDDTQVCDAANQPDNNYVSGNAGDDSITVEADASAYNAMGDAGNGGVPLAGDGGNDNITINGTVDGLVYGDNVDGNGGDDSIVINGTVGQDVYGDMAGGDAGSDTIVVNGTVGGTVYADNAQGNAADDTVVINGTVNGSVEGDAGNYTGGNDTITVNGVVNGDVNGDFTGGNGGDDTIIINGEVGGSVIGDNASGGTFGTNGSGGDDTITISGIVHGDVLGDYVSGQGGDDTVVLQDGAVVDGVIDGEGGNDTLTFSFSTDDEFAYNDWLVQIAAAMPEGGTITINGNNYTWRNFEELQNLVRLSGPNKGRILCYRTVGAIYANPDGIFVYSIDPSSQGSYEISLTADQLAALPGQPQQDTPLATSQDGRFVIWQLASGDYQVTLQSDTENKIQVITFNAVVPTQVTCDEHAT